MQTDAETQGVTEESGFADSGILVSVIMQVDTFEGRKMRACLRVSDAAGNKPRGHWACLPSPTAAVTVR